MTKIDYRTPDDEPWMAYRMRVEEAKRMLGDNPSPDELKKYRRELIEAEKALRHATGM